MRNLVLIFGGFDFDTKPFLERNLNVIRPKIGEAIPHFKYAKAIIIADYPHKYALIKQCFEQFLKVADNCGILKVILFHNDIDFLQIKAIRGNSKEDNFLNEILPIGEITRVAELVARHDPGPPLDDIIVEPLEMAIGEEVKLLLQRSFYGCEKIYLEPIGGGKASIHLFRVHAWIKESEVGPLPLPFFAKIASPDEIEIEKRNYKTYTDQYISFQYRPNLRLERCIRTRNYASLVGNFVDDSISLRTALEDTHHNGILFSLFERSLKGFRIQPIVSRKMPSVGPLNSFINNIISVDRLLLKEDVISKANELGLKSDVKKLNNRLLDVSAKTSCIIGPFHGDLHSGNVIVRGNDAILIDFYSVNTSGPLTADPASLEISLSFNLNEKGRFPEFGPWKIFIDEAYGANQLLVPPALSDKIPNEFTWLRRAIREIRHILIGCQCCPEETKVVMAAYLMRFSRLPSTEDKDNKKGEIEFMHHAYALVVAEQIIDSFGI